MYIGSTDTTGGDLDLYRRGDVPRGGRWLPIGINGAWFTTSTTLSPEQGLNWIKSPRLELILENSSHTFLLSAIAPLYSSWSLTGLALRSFSLVLISLSLFIKKSTSLSSSLFWSITISIWRPTCMKSALISWLSSCLTLAASKTCSVRWTIDSIFSRCRWMSYLMHVFSLPNRRFCSSNSSFSCFNLWTRLCCSLTQHSKWVRWCYSSASYEFLMLNWLSIDSMLSSMSRRSPSA